MKQPAQHCRTLIGPERNPGDDVISQRLFLVFVSAAGLTAAAAVFWFLFCPLHVHSPRGKTHNSPGITLRVRFGWRAAVSELVVSWLLALL